MRMQHIAATNEIKDHLSVVGVGEFPSVVGCIQLYMSFATATARKMQRVVAQPMLAQDTQCVGYRVCAQAAMTLCTCNVTDRLLMVNVNFDSLYPLK